MIVHLDGEKLTSESDFHDAITASLALSQYYGRNLSALHDVLSTDVERPLQLVWNNADISRRAMGADFDRIVGVLRRIESEDARIGYLNRFQLLLPELAAVRAEPVQRQETTRNQSRHRMRYVLCLPIVTIGTFAWWLIRR